METSSLRQFLIILYSLSQQFMGEDMASCQGIAHSSETTEVDSASKNLCAEDNACI